MPNTNIVIIEGHLTKPPVAREVKNGSAVCNFTVATSIGTGDKAKTQFHSCTIWGPEGAALAMNGKTGDIVSLKGRIEYRKWEDKYFTDIIVEHLHLTAKKAKGVSDEFIAE